MNEKKKCREGVVVSEYGAPEVQNHTFVNNNHRKGEHTLSTHRTWYDMIL